MTQVLFCRDHKTYFHRQKSVDDHRVYARCRAPPEFVEYDAKTCRSESCEPKLHQESPP